MRSQHNVVFMKPARRNLWGRTWEDPILTRFLVLIDCSKLSAQIFASCPAQKHKMATGCSGNKTKRF
jgi:hypothetical protein